MSIITQIRESLGMEPPECFTRSNEDPDIPGFPTLQTWKQAEARYPDVHNRTVMKLAKGLGLSHIGLLLKE